MIIVTGTPGTGKTTFAKELAKKLDYEYIDLQEFAKDLIIGFDKERDSNIIDEEKIDSLKLPKNSVVDSHMSHYISPKKVEKCYVTKCDLKTLKKRLETRGYSKEKVRENLDAEIFDVCRIEALERGHDVEVVYT